MILWNLWSNKENWPCCQRPEVPSRESNWDMRTFRERDRRRRRRDSESKSPVWNRNGYYSNVNESQRYLKKSFEVFEEWAINIKLGNGYPTWEKMLRQGKVLRRYYFGLSFHKIFPELLFHILCSPNSSKISLCLFANSGVIVLERLKKNRVEAKSKFSPLSPYESI